LKLHRLFQSDDLTFGLEAPFVREITIDGAEVAQTIAFSVRDKAWGTINSSGWTETVEEDEGTISVDLVGRFTSAEIDLAAVIALRAAPDGSLTYHVKATALRDFERARIGICVMHPATWGGTPLHVTTPDNTYASVFPVEVSPSRRITDIVSMRHPIGNGRDVVFEFRGDLFELEDQRNWADASYKTFSTPLGLPWPVQIHAGDVIEQQVRISTVGKRVSLSPPSQPPRSKSASIRVDLDDTGGIVPSIGVHCDESPASLDAARNLGSPHIRVSIDAKSDTASADLVEIGKALAFSGTSLELEIVADKPDDLPPLYGDIAGLGSRLRSVFVFDRSTQITGRSYRSAMKDLRSTTAAAIGGGSGSDFGAFNFRLDEVDRDSLDILTFPISPQVHYKEHFSLVANLKAQAALAASARRLAWNGRVSIGPIMLLPRRAGEPLKPDPLAKSLLAASWTVASLSELIPSKVEALTYHHIGDPTGILDRNGRPTPTYHVLADLAGFAGANYCSTHITSPHARVAALAVRDRSSALIIIASLEPEPVDIEMLLPVADATLRILDENTYDVARTDRANFVRTGIPWENSRLHMLPFAVATLEVTLQ